MCGRARRLAAETGGSRPGRAGSSEALGGELAVIPGYHLHRDPFKWNSARPDDDEGMEAYLAAHGMAHPLTGESLRVKHLNLPPGSLVSIPAHMPHYVSSRKPGAGTRWALLLTVRRPPGAVERP